jgi:hypothetical protein
VTASTIVPTATSSCWSHYRIVWLLNCRRWEWKARVGTGSWRLVTTHAPKTFAIWSYKNARRYCGTGPSGTSWIVTDMWFPMPRTLR